MNRQSLEALVEQGLTALEIGKKTGNSESAVRRLLKKHDLKTHRYNHHDPEATHRKCRYCGEIKSIEEFAVAGAVAGEKNGQVYRRWRCLGCYTKLKRDRRHSLQDFILKHKKEKQCELCGNDDYRVLQFHHGDSNKEFNLGDAPRMGLSKQRIIEEMQKCKVYCGNCHLIEHWEETHLRALGKSGIPPALGAGVTSVRI